MSRPTTKLKARLPRGFADRGPADLAATHRMLEAIRETYELYGFEAVETPFVEYTDALGKFLPDQDRPNEGVFSFQDDDEQWLSLRYDLTAPLARHVAENFDALPKPYRSYRFGWVFRNEKPGPGRFRQFMQFDADTVGSGSVAADAEMCMMAADTLERVGIPRGEYVIKVNNRKILDGVLESVGLGGEQNAGKRLAVLRALDKYDRLGLSGVRDLLGKGRKDESGDFTRGADLTNKQIAPLLRFVRFGEIYDAIQRGEFTEVDTHFPNPFMHPPATWDSNAYLGREATMAAKAVSLKSVNPDNRVYDYSFGLDVLGEVALLFEMNDTLAEGIHELAEMEALFQASGYVGVVRRESDAELESSEARILIDPSIVRGLEYYTGPVYEAELTFTVTGDEGQPVRFGSVGGGGRYDGLIGRFRNEPVPATGFSIGVSRLLAALQAVKSSIVTGAEAPGPVVVLVMDRERIADYQRMVATLRAGGVRAELYLGASGMKAQMKYADRRRSPCVVIQGSDERARGEVQIKDLALGAALAAGGKDRADYLDKQAEAQFSVPEGDLLSAVRKVIGRAGR
jgi:histidyl-tRNA synthetase